MINSFDSHDNVISMNNILTDSLLNMVFCINEGKASKFKKIIDDKNRKCICTINECSYDYIPLRKRIVFEEPENSALNV